MSRARVLLVEDNPADVLLLSEALETGGWAPEVTLAGDGPQALALLRTLRPVPDLLVLDLNLPGLSGRELLAAVQADPALAGIQVLILSGSAWERGVTAEFALADACYQVKPDSFEGFLEIAARAEWLSRAGRGDGRPD